MKPTDTRKTCHTVAGVVLTSNADNGDVCVDGKLFAQGNSRRILFAPVSGDGDGQILPDGTIGLKLGVLRHFPCKTHMEHNLPYEQLYQAICDRFGSIGLHLGVDVGLTGELEEIKAQLENGASYDYIASRGEYLNGKLIAAYLGYDFVDAKDVIKFDKNGRLMEDETDEAIAKELAKHQGAVIPGFYGSKPNGEIKTFSRGGSDVTGSLVARAINAEVYENWTDVSGFLVADPRIIPDAKPINTISYKELRELSYMEPASHFGSQGRCSKKCLRPWRLVGCRKEESCLDLLC